MKFLGIEIERKTDILAMAAFLISIGSIIGQLALLIRGAEIVLDGPRQVVLLFEEPTEERGYLNAISTHIYVNNGTPGYDDILKSEKLLIQLNGYNIELTAQDNVYSTRIGNKLFIKQRVPWKPEKIRAGDFVSQETLFVPHSSFDSPEIDRNFVDSKDFKLYLSKTDEVKIVLKAETYGGQKISAECYIGGQDAQVNIEKKMWSSLDCYKKKIAWNSFTYWIPGLGD